MKPRLTFPFFLALVIGGWPAALIATAEEFGKQTGAPTDPGSSTDPTPKSKNGRCTVRKESNGWWLVDPQGQPFFSLGVCVFNQGSRKDEYDPAKPSYAALRHYDGPDSWADDSLLRLKSWGFTTVGGWSDYPTLRQSRENDLWTTSVISLGARSGSPWFDMWDDKVVRRIHELAAETITPLRTDARTIGYYSDNEIGWWNAILWKMTLEQPATSGQRQRLIAQVRESYDGDWNRLLKDFEPQNASSWQELDRAGLLWLRPGAGGIGAMRRFLSMVSDRYYALMREAIHKQDPDALYLGDRYQSFYYPELAQAAARHVDVVSTNFNASWNDGAFIRSYFDTLYALTMKPIIVSEFYMAADENSSGNRNKVGGFPTVADQRERAAALSTTLRHFVRLPYLVGADWFQFYDEPPHGRKLDGEDYNFGLVDIHNRPYADVTAAFKSMNLSGLKAEAVPAEETAKSGIPRAPADPFDQFEPMLALKDWDRVRGFVPAASEHPLGDMYVCWSPEAVYLGTYVHDVVEPDYYRDGDIPEIDRAKWTIRINDGDPITARVGSGKNATIDDPAIRMKSISGTYHMVRCITAIEIPAARLKKARLAPGDRIKLECTFLTHARAYRIDWKGEFVLRD
jgi:hypothetical protein